MAPKRSKPSSSGSFDRSKFISVEAFTRYHTSLINQRPIPERGIEIPILPYKEINDMIHDRYWCQFCHQPDATVVPVVREFYANVVEHVDGVAFVRGKRVPFHSQAINKFLRTPNIENDEYGQYLGDH